MEDLYEFEIDENALDIFLSEEDEQLDEKSSKRAKRKRRAKKKKKKAKRDACYYKVKSRYDVWPSAYASGALTKCRKVGAKNWGNKSKKNESVEEELAKIIEQELRNDFQHIFQEELAAVIEEKKKKRKKKKKKKRQGLNQVKNPTQATGLEERALPVRKVAGQIAILVEKVNVNHVDERKARKELNILLVDQLPVPVKKRGEEEHGAKNQPKERNNGFKTNYSRRI